jgi:fructuronate reductase
VSVVADAVVAGKFLDPQALGHLRAAIRQPAYPVQASRIGVVHFGPGAFHRAHQAWCFDDILARDFDWAVSAVSLKTSAVHDALEPQHGLYCVAVQDEPRQLRVIGALRELIVAPQDPARVLSRLTSKHTRLVTLTVTEAGYCLGADGRLDLNHPDIRRDLAQPDAPTSAVGYLVEALRRRRAESIKPFTTISCDSLPDNGRRLMRAAVDLAMAQRQHDLARWIVGEAAFPCSAVDCIVPPTDDALRQQVAQTLGCRDRWPVQRESYAQWVIEDRFCNRVPDWASVGVTVTRDVAAVDRMKVRVLYAAQTAIAYLGLACGHATVADAMADAPLAALVERLLRRDVLPVLNVPRELGADAYVTATLKRLRNPAIRHDLNDLARDGSLHVSTRLIATLADRLAQGEAVDRLCLPIAAWLDYLRREARDGRAIVDPLTESLTESARNCVGNAASDLPEFLALDAIFPLWLSSNPRFVEPLTRAYDRIASVGEPNAAKVHAALAGMV